MILPFALLVHPHSRFGVEIGLLLSSSQLKSDKVGLHKSISNFFLLLSLLQCFLVRFEHHRSPTTILFIDLPYCAFSISVIAITFGVILRCCDSVLDYTRTQHKHLSTVSLSTVNSAALFRLVRIISYRCNKSAKLEVSSHDDHSTYQLLVSTSSIARRLSDKLSHTHKTRTFLLAFGASICQIKHLFKVPAETH
jgi:hypothetical protein